MLRWNGVELVWMVIPTPPPQEVMWHRAFFGTSLCPGGTQQISLIFGPPWCILIYIPQQIHTKFAEMIVDQHLSQQVGRILVQEAKPIRR